MRRNTVLPLLAACIWSSWASAQTSFSDNRLVIGVMGDQGGVVADVGGPGSIVAAKMAIEDAGGAIDGVPIELLTADHQNKPDIALNLAREWFDRQGVDAIVDLPHTGAVLGLMTLATEKKRALLVSGAASVEITARCSPYVTHWTDDTYALARGTAAALTEQNLRSWFFLTADYGFGHDLERDASRVIEDRGGKVLGSARHPLNTADFASLLLRAQGSGAEVIALASAGADTVNAIKQARQFAIGDSGQRLVALHAFITDVNSLGLDVAQGMTITTGFYWDDNAGTRAFAERFAKRHGRMPTREQAGVYVSLAHYLKAVKASRSDDAATVNAAMRRNPVDRFGTEARILANGRVVYDLGVYRVKTPAQSSYPWDYYEKIATIPADQAFRSVAESGCAAAGQSEARAR